MSVDEVAEARKGSTLMFEIVQYFKNTKPQSNFLTEMMSKVYLCAAGADGLSMKEEFWIRTYFQAQNWWHLDMSACNMDMSTCMQQMKETMKAGGFSEDICKLGVIDTATHCYAACASDGLVTKDERLRIVEMATWWGMDPEKVIDFAKSFYEKEIALIDKKMAILGQWTRDVWSGYGADDSAYLSFERLYFCKSDAALQMDDIKKQMECIMATCDADGTSDLEKKWIEAYSIFCGGGIRFSVDIPPPINDVKGIIQDIASRSGLPFKTLASELIYNCIRACQIDGISPQEDSAIRTVALQMDVAEKIEPLIELTAEELAWRGESLVKSAEIVGVDLAAMMAEVENSEAK